MSSNNTREVALFKHQATIDLSIVIVAYNMHRELPRTIYTLLAPYQKFVSDLRYEIIVVDNGSTGGAVKLPPCQDNVVIRYVDYENPTSTPIPALNFGMSISRGELICACIDGARMFTPNLIRTSVAASRSVTNAVIGTHSYHIGHEAQNISVRRGFNQAAEDLLLQTVNWERDGYELFRIGSFDPSSRFGLFRCPAETNSLIMSRDQWQRHGGFDERFTSSGGGLANLDFWARLVNDNSNDLVMLLGEGTFHQFHGGAATNAVVDPWDTMHEEYIAIKGERYRDPDRVPLVFGKMHEFAREFLNNRINTGSEW